MSGYSREESDEEYIRHFVNIDNTLLIKEIFSKQNIFTLPQTSLGEVDWRFMDKDDYNWL